MVLGLLIRMPSYCLRRGETDKELIKRMSTWFVYGDFGLSIPSVDKKGMCVGTHIGMYFGDLLGAKQYIDKTAEEIIDMFLNPRGEELYPDPSDPPDKRKRDMEMGCYLLLRDNPGWTCPEHLKEEVAAKMLQMKLDEEG
jgi:hypothetical protein